MRILMISDVYFPRVNGVSTAIMTLRRELRRMGHHVTLVAPDYGTVTEDEEAILRIPARPVWLDPEDRLMQRRRITELLPYLQSQTFDVVHIHTPFVAHYAGIAPWVCPASRLTTPFLKNIYFTMCRSCRKA